MYIHHSSLFHHLAQLSPFVETCCMSLSLGWLPSRKHDSLPNPRSDVLHDNPQRKQRGIKSFLAIPFCSDKEDFSQWCLNVARKQTLQC